MAKTIQPAKHINVIREDAVTTGAYLRRFESIHRRSGLFRLHIVGGDLPQTQDYPRDHYWAS